MREKKPTNEPVIIQDSLDIKLSFLKNTQAQTTEEKAIKIKQELDNIPHKNKEIQKPNIPQSIKSPQLKDIIRKKNKSTKKHEVLHQKFSKETQNEAVENQNFHTLKINTFQNDFQNFAKSQQKTSNKISLESQKIEKSFNETKQYIQNMKKNNKE